MPKQRPTSIERQASQQKRSKETHVRRAPLGQVGSGKVLQPAVHTADKLTRHYTHTHPFNGPLPGTTRVSRYQKGRTNLDFTEARDSEWQWHQLGPMQVCTSLPDR